MVYVGLDVHRKRTQVAILDDTGKQIANRNVPNDPGELTPLLAALEPGTPVAFESAYGWGWVAELLDDLGLDPHLAHAKSCKAIASARLKNDKVDARTLAHLLRADLLAEAHIAPREVRDLRRILRHRATLVRFSTRLKNRVHAVSPTTALPSPGPCGPPRDGSGFHTSSYPRQSASWLMIAPSSSTTSAQSPVASKSRSAPRPGKTGASKRSRRSTASATSPP